MLKINMKKDKDIDVQNAIDILNFFDKKQTLKWTIRKMLKLYYAHQKRMLY